MSTCTTITSKNKLLIAVAVLLAVLIISVAVASVLHVVGYFKTEGQLETFDFGLPSSITIENCGSEYTAEATVYKDDAYYARMVYMLDEAFTSVERFSEIHEKDLDQETEYYTVTKLEYDSPAIIKLMTKNGVLELQASALHIVLDGSDEGKITVFTDEKDYVFGKLELSYELESYMSDLLWNLDSEWEF